MEAVSSDTAFTNLGVGPSGLSLAEPSDFFALMKPRVMSLVVFTAWAGLVSVSYTHLTLPTILRV